MGAAISGRLVNYYASEGNAVQIAFEPNGGLSAVEDGEYIRKWARDARESGAPILLRWACEMNGNWVAWHGNPELYKEKFRLIAGIMKEEAPNVAMVWAPNDIPHVPGNPLYDIHGYYPGDEYTDWVGIDFYGVYFYENGTPERKDPREKLRVVYEPTQAGSR
jgi:beta-mannanase